jgi:hypothetical protein
MISSPIYANVTPSIDYHLNTINPHPTGLELQYYDYHLNTIHPHPIGQELQVLLVREEA